MHKDFDVWNIQKKSLEESIETEPLYFHEGDIWWCSLGINIGSEASGKGMKFRRPILVLKKLSSDTCIALPLSSQLKTGSWFEEISFNGELRSVLLYQIRHIHKKRFQRKMGELDEKDMMCVRKKLEQLLKLSPESSPGTTGIDG